MTCDDPKSLPGYRKKSFLLPYAGGEIWFEHLDGIYDHSELVIEKLQGDSPKLSSPSSPSVVGFVLNETEVTSEIVASIADALLGTRKVFRRVCFIGASKQAQRALRAALAAKAFALAFADDLEKAKEWLVQR